MGIVFGMMVGFIFVDNFFVVMVGMFVLVICINLFVVMLSGFMFVWIGFFFDLFFYCLGGILFGVDLLWLLWNLFYDMMFVFWIWFNNMVVMGSVVFLIVMFYLIFYIVELLVKKFGLLVYCCLMCVFFYCYLVVDVEESKE